MDDSLKQLLASHPRLWRGRDRSRQRPWRSSLDTGHSDLNRVLHGGGWPRGVSNELYLPGQGIGELRLLLPALRRLAGDGYLCWVAPPHIPFAPALARQGVDLQRLLIVPAQTPADRLWAMEQALLAQCCEAVFGWFDDAMLGLRELRRLQLAAEHSGVWSVLLRHHRCRHLPSPSALRLRLWPEARGRLALEVLKQPGGWAGQTLTLSIAPHYEQWQRLPVDLLPVCNANPLPVIGAGSTTPGVTATFPAPALTRSPQ